MMNIKEMQEMAEAADKFEFPKFGGEISVSSLRPRPTATLNSARIKAVLDCVDALEKSCALLEAADKAGLYLDSDKKEILNTGRAALKALDAA